jgi:hypothetical protein
MIAALVIAASAEVRRQIHAALGRDRGLAILAETASCADGLTAFRRCGDTGRGGQQRGEDCTATRRGAHLRLLLRLNQRRPY